MSADPKRGKMTVAEAGKRGGEKTSETHGPEFYSEIGTKGGTQRAKQHQGTLEAQGKTSLEEAGHRGGQRIKNLVEKGRTYEST